MFTQNISVEAARFAGFGQKWTRAMIKSDWTLKDGIEASLEIEAFETMLSKTIAENNLLIFTCLRFMKSSDFENSGWSSSVSDCGAYNIHRLFGIKHSYPEHVAELSFKVSSSTTHEDVLRNLC